MRECSVPSVTEISEGATVMLTTNQIVELSLMNGRIGTVVGSAAYENRVGTRAEGRPMPAYVIVNFPQRNIPEEDKQFDNLDRTCVAIVQETDRCEKWCCTITYTPLHVCKSITIHKSQGMIIGERQLWKKVIIYLPIERRWYSHSRIASGCLF